MSANKQTRNQNLRKPPSDFQRLSRRFMSSALRSLFLLNRSTRYSRAGFVLPTTVLLLLVMTLTVGALTFRSVSRTQSAILDREQQLIENMAAPAADRGKAKLEYLFSKDTRMPGTSTPASDVLATLMLNIDNNASTGGNLGITALGTDPYTLPDETRLDINNDGTVDNAWSFSFDLNGDGINAPDEVIAYSLLMDDSVDQNAVPTPTRDDDITIENSSNVDKANALVTRNGPINTNNLISNCGGSRVPAQGWLTVNNATLEKNFQLTAFVKNGNSAARANSAFELQQVRIAQRGNTWGAWFKYDMEVHPGPEFNWNGAIHTDGNLMVTNNLRAHMISSHNSCLYTRNASEVTMAQVDGNDDGVINVTAAGSPDFQGQLIAGAPTYGDLNARGNPDFHIFTNLNNAPTIGTGLTTANDSVQGTTYNHLLDLALDPVALFTRNISRHRRTGTWQRATNWATNPFNAGGRVFNQNQNQPFLDDFYRADNRYGPSPNYATYNWVTDTDRDDSPSGGPGAGINTTRNDPAYDKRLGDEIIESDPRADGLTNNTDGLDGYWERKAIANGMRVVVGQRLELGNHLGWNTTISGTSDPLYPPQPSDTMTHRQKQRVTLRDNLAAVQGMVVYHYQSNNGMSPRACIATTAHPGTLQTIRNSRTFNHYTETGAVKTDFLTGQGTNGWEFSFPTAFDTEAEFGAQLESNQPLGTALRNLAYFAGDPNGGSPSFTPVQDNTVHPFPHQAMWGDFSVLRRIFDERLDAIFATAATTNRSAIPAWRPAQTNMAARYAALSPADKSSLHSAACTLGLLAYNLNANAAEYAAVPTTGTAGLNALGVQLAKLMDGNIPNGEIGTNPTTNLCTGSAGSAGCPPVTYSPGYYQQFTAAQWLNALENDGALGANLPIAIYRAQVISEAQQIARDRTLGFLPAGTLVGLPGAGVGYTAATATYAYQGSGGSFASQSFRVACDPTSFAASGGNSEEAQLGLAMAFCSVTQGPRYPSLHYLFPTRTHDQLGVAPYLQPTAEEYINQNYLTDATNGVNQLVAYGVVGDNAAPADIEDENDLGIAAIAFAPRASNPTATGTDRWALPATISAASPAGALNPESMDIKVINGASNVNVALALLDKVMYNGREEMAVRVLDVDLEKLTRNRAGTDYWISDNRDTNNGIFYAVREDAAREDSITRPASTANWTSCDSFDELLTNACWMRANRTAASGGPTDPPLSRRGDNGAGAGSFVGISVKPVDFLPDPDRRPYGFRLNAALNGNNGDLSDRTNRERGLTFVTDNLAYIKGEFNPHTSNGTNTLEEFTQTLFDNTVAFGARFYNNRTTPNLGAFATTSGDRWRVAEVLADAVYLLSDNFVDGAVQEGFIRNRSANSTEFRNAAGALSRTSFHNQQKPAQNGGDAWGGANDWFRIDGGLGSSGGDSTIPIWVGRNGESRVRRPDGSNRDFIEASDDNNFDLPDERGGGQITALVPERMNATIISGLVPSRNRQGYGGLHNFPRFLENWNGNLFIQGAFLQLNFSTSGTGPFDLDAWEPGDVPAAAERIGYYGPPGRRWGYDVGLQFAPVGPIAERFVSIGRPRSEHYRELPIEDPYVTNLRCSRVRQNPDDPSSPLIARFDQEICPP